MRESDFIFDSVQLLYYECHKTNFKRGASYMDSPEWIKKKKTTINPKNTDNKCFQYAATVALHYGEIKWSPERVSNIKPYTSKYNWKGINHPTKIDDGKCLRNNILYPKKKKYFQLIFQNITQPRRNK